MKEKMAEIMKQAKELEKLLEIISVSNKIWVPRVGLVDLWEVKK